MKFFTILLICVFMLSCSIENTSEKENLSYRSSLGKQHSEEYSFIINGEKHKMTLEYANNATFIVQNEESELILSIFEKENPVFYYNPEIENIVLFADFDSYSKFIDNKTEVNSLKTKFKSKVSSISKLNLKTIQEGKITSNVQFIQGPVYGATPNVTIYQDVNFNGNYLSLPMYYPSYIFSSSYTKNITGSTGGHFQDRISSIKVTNAYAGFWRHSNFDGYLLIIDSYNFVTEVSDLRDVPLKNYTIYNGAGSYCGTFCNGWNDQISSLKARGDGIKSFKF